ncbi:hypothetical protein G9A89_021564 [Geosiphon pyriformis]|nr:hypothetical protein G9A89_021564 [Geosiphon pyriformis]
MQIISKISHIRHYHPISHGSQRHVSTTTVVNKAIFKLTAILIVIYNWKINIKTQLWTLNAELLCKLRSISIHLPTNNAAAYLSTNHILNPNLSTTATSNISTTAVTNNLSDICNSNTIKSHSKLEISNSCLPTNPQLLYTTIRIMVSEFRNWVHTKLEFPILFNNIPLATIIEDESLVAIFSFEIEEPSKVSLFNSGSADSIIIRQLINQLGCQVNQATSTRIITANEATKTPIGKINDLFIKVNDIIIPIKILLSQNGQYTCVPAMCDHFKPIIMPSALLIEFEKEEKKLTWEAYQVFWTNMEHNELPSVFFWDNKEKGKEKDIPKETTTTEGMTNDWKKEYSHKLIKKPPYIPLKYKDYRKKLSFMEAWIAPDKDYWTKIHYYYKLCHRECYGYPKKQKK